jgi:hypothetical protein
MEIDWCYDYNRLCVLEAVELLTEQHDAARRFFERAITTLSPAYRDLRQPGEVSPSRIPAVVVP